MSTRSFINQSPFVSVILAITLCFVLSVSAVAARSGQNKDKQDRGKVSEQARDNDRDQKNERNDRNQKNERSDQGKKTDRDDQSKKNDRDKKPNGSIKLKNNNVTIKIGDKNWNHNEHYAYPTYRPVKNYDPAHPVLRQTHYTHWVFDLRTRPSSRRSVYFYFGYFPYVQTTYIRIRPYVSVSYCSAPIIINDGYYLNRGSSYEIDDTLADIRSAWLDGRSDLIKRHIDSSREIAVLLDGKYDYSIASSDYLDMTTDAIDQMKTVAFTWQSVRKRTDGSYTAYAKHTYVDQNGTAQTVYVSYTIDGYRGDYDIVEVGSSASPLN